jgi:hypothetical protein
VDPSPERLRACGDWQVLAPPTACMYQHSRREDNVGGRLLLCVAGLMPAYTLTTGHLGEFPRPTHLYVVFAVIRLCGTSTRLPLVAETPSKGARLSSDREDLAAGYGSRLTRAKHELPVRFSDRAEQQPVCQSDWQQNQDQRY